MKSLSILTLVALTSSLVIAENNWPCFRGAKQNSTTTESKWNPAAITNAPLWSFQVGEGHSNVAIQDGKLYTMGNVDDIDTVFCLDAKTGKEIWKYSYPSKKGNFPGPRSTPTIANGKCYTFGRSGTVLALNAKNGKLIWQKNVVKDFELPIIRWGLSGSIVVYKDSLLLNVGEYGLAISAKNGSKKWATAAKESSCSTFVMAEIDKKLQAVIISADTVYGLNPADGKVIWQHPWKHERRGTNASDPIIWDNQLFLSSGYNKGCALVKVNGKATTNLWQNDEMCAHFSTPVLADGYIYGSNGNTGKADMKCIEAKTGKVKWTEKTNFCSALRAADKIIIISEKGKLSVLKVNPNKFESLATTQLFNDKSATSWTMPVLCNSKLYCRNSKGHLVCLNLKK